MEHDDRGEAFRRGAGAARLSAIILFALSASKTVIALLSGSISLLADAIHSVADIFASVAVWAALRLIQRRPSEHFPFGLYRAETFALLIVATTIVASGILIIMEAIEKLTSPSAVMFPSLVISVAAISGVISFFLARYKEKTGKTIGSQSLISEGQHSLVDVYTSIIVFVGVLFSSLGYPVAEALTGLVIGADVVKVGAESVRDAVYSFLDVSLSPDQIEEIRQIAQSMPGVKGVHAIRFRRSGPVIFGEMHIEMPKGTPLEIAHDASKEIEETIKKCFKDVESINIHPGTPHAETIKIGIPIQSDEGLGSKVSPNFGDAPLFAFVEVERGQILKMYSKPNDSAKPGGQAEAAARLLLDEKVDTIIVESLEEGKFCLLRDNLMQVYTLPKPATIEEAVHLLAQNKLEKMTSPRNINKTKDTDTN